jgi:hypothetical protein
MIYTPQVMQKKLNPNTDLQSIVIKKENGSKYTATNKNTPNVII